LTKEVDGACPVLEEPASPGANTVVYPDSPQHGARRELKAQLSEASVDSNGFPNMLRSPAKSVDVEDKFSTKPTFMRRRIGYSANPNSKPWQRIEENTALRAALGFPCSARVTVEEKEPLEKDAVPSASKVRKVLKKPATKAAPLDKESRWLKLRKTNANTGRIRSYITGCKAKRGKMVLI
jgi:hypothetical protein